ncbi:CHASE3 domain-containing protein [Spirosoma sp. RP8]|uniref:histidine kinase n=1 Tax=Spirosoma liriopis TaxID=2937440 RepID=A0ABT0HFB2_9BACT|nr:CHASE3 domain-containing protein [Spirosoma liriopis]MCK8490846.1 CHASE3 domain-containing protein [Spirosoma liriopis]
MKLLKQSAPKIMNRRIALGFFVAMVLIASGFTLSFYSYNQYRTDTERVRHTYEVVGSLESILSLVKDVETGSRGYIITSDSAYLDNYQVAITVLPSRLEQLHTLMADNDNTVQIQRAGKLDHLVADKLALSQLRVKNRSMNVPYTRSLNGEGKRRMDVLRRHIAVMVDTERSLMETRNRQAARSFRNTLIIIFALSLLTFLSLVVSYQLLEQELARRQQNEDQLRAYEARLREQIRQLESSNEELERFAFVASHDLQEPLRKIQSFANLITDRYGNLFDGDSLLFMNKIVHSAERMSKLIKDLLNFSRISNHQEEFKPVPLGMIIQRILDDQELRIKGLNVLVEVGSLPTIPAISSQMDHLFTNLISNALKFARPDVQPLIRIQARSVKGSAYPELISERLYSEITVQDNGIGFDEKYLDHIFKVFQRLHGKSEFEGTGIGLAICKRVTVSHHGYITAKSQPGQGTTFIVVLPESQSLQDYDRSNPTESYSYSAS